MKAASHSLVLGLTLTLVGLAALGLTSQIDFQPLSRNGDPGPRLLPFLLGGILALGGILECGLAGRQRAQPQSDTDHDSEPVSKQTWFLMLSLAVYILALPWAGFFLATFILVLLLVMRQKTRWWLAAATAGALVAIVYLLFVVGFEVPLPTGLLGR